MTTRVDVVPARVTVSTALRSTLSAMHRRIARGSRSRTRSTALISLVAATVLLAGCAVQPISSATDDEAHERFLALLDDTQGVIGGEWEVMDDPTPRECVIPLWVGGTRMPALRVGEPASSPASAADLVAEEWEAQGIQVTRTDVGDVLEVKGETDDHELLVLRLSDSASTLLGESECRPA